MPAVPGGAEFNSKQNPCLSGRGFVSKGKIKYA
jgi:hypothetical protein